MQSRAELHNLVRELGQRATTILLATHDMAEAEKLAGSFALAAWLFQWDSRASQPNRRAALAILGALPYVAAMLAG